MSAVAFTALEYHADGGLRPAAYRFEGSETGGWLIEREWRAHLRLGPGYRLLEVSHCGVCATDLARRHLPFPLPQVTGHEVVARLESGELAAVEINASHTARGLAPCSLCAVGLATHCPDRLVLGIHDLPGGFAPWVLAPAGGIVALPPAISPATAILVEPFAAALNAADRLALRDGERVAVLGPRRLGSLVIAALAARRAQSGRRYEIVALARREPLRRVARALGADDTLDTAEAAGAHDLFDVVIDTSASASGLALALDLARREVHLKSTTGQPALGLTHLTELVVDELTLAPAGAAGGADPEAPVVTTLAEIDACIRPTPGVERSRVRPRGTILVADAGQPRAGLLAPLLDKKLRLSSSRCGDLRAAVALLAAPASDLGERLGALLVSHVLPAERLAEAFACAAGPASVKVAVTHPGSALGSPRG